MVRIASGCAVLMLATVLLVAGEYWVRSSVTVLASSFPVITASSLPRLEPDRPLKFATDSNFLALLDGWRRREPWGAWSDGYQATVGFRIGNTEALTSTSSLLLEVRPYLAPPVVMKQRVQVSIESIPVGAFVFTEPVPMAKEKIPFEGAGLKPDDVVVLKFSFPDATSRRGEAISDNRTLAMGIVSIELAP